MAKNPGGRPLHGDTPKRAAISVKVRQDLRDFLEGSARRSGRSFTMEVEDRLEASRLAHMLDSDIANSKFAALFAAILGQIEALSGCLWFERSDTLAMSKGALAELIERFGPNGGTGDLAEALSGSSSDAEKASRVRAYIDNETYHARFGAKIASDVIARLAPDLADSSPRLSVEDL